MNANTILHYVDLRGDLLASQFPYNEIDALIFSELAYVYLDDIFNDTKPITLQQAFQKYQQRNATLTPENLKKILYIGVDEKDITVGVTRREAVFKILRKSPDIEITEIKSDFSLEKTEILVDEYLKNNSPDCIVSATDNMAFGAMKAIYRHGYKIPEDISILGFGGYKISDVVTPRLTTIKYNNEMTGKLAAETIIKLIRNEEVPKIQKIDYEFLDRESVK